MHLGEHYFGDTIKFTEDKKLYLTSQFKKVNDQYNEIERERESSYCSIISSILEITLILFLH